MNNFNKQPKIAIIGLGYVGLPLAVAFSEKFAVVGYDINEKRVNELERGIDSTNEIESSMLQDVMVNQLTSKGLLVSTNLSDIEECQVYIITVPTPTDKNNRPVLKPMIKASEAVASVLKPNDVVIYESTVYPGVTEEEMVPILESRSGKKYNQDFFCGYSPERINPGDKQHTVTKILKVTSGSTQAAADYIDWLYNTVITAGTHKASSIKVAEASKVIENSQRDINIAFVNELAKIFSFIGIDTNEVLEAAGTKWNFLKFKPGLVGGHCIGVDPYYLAQKAQELGYHPEIILAGRKVNNSMGEFIANQVLKLLIHEEIQIKNTKVLILGFTFKENCPDIRNSRVVDILESLNDFGLKTVVYDPWANTDEVMMEYGISIVNELPTENFGAAIIAVAHSEFLEPNFRDKINSRIIYDAKGVLPKESVNGRL